MAPRLWTCQVNQCLCCSLRAGIITMSILAFVNACLAFAGEAALFSGMLSAVAEKAAGKYLPAGTKVPDASDTTAQGGLIFLGLYALAVFIFGMIAALRRRVWAATAFYVMMLLDTALGITLTVILWLAGGSFNSLLAQIPVFVLNVYMCIVASSYRRACKDWAAGGELAAPSGADAADVTAVGGAKAPDAVEYRDGPNGVAGASVLAEDDDDEEDGDLAGRPAARV